jgi:hypothetical protein
MTRDIQREQLATKNAEVERLTRERDVLKEALEIIAGKRQCLDNLMGNRDVAESALASLDQPAAAEGEKHD